MPSPIAQATVRVEAERCYAASHQKNLRDWRYLQALDGEAAGATHREIAIAIFGEQDVWQRWTHDNSEIRAPIRTRASRRKLLVAA